MSATEGSLAGRRYLVTGATSGVGEAVVRALAAAGARATGLGRRQERLDGLAFAFGPAFEAIRLDLGDRDALERWLAGRDLSGFDGLVLAAGHDLGGNRPFGEETAASRRSKIAVNLEAALTLVSAMLPGFLARDRGDVLAIGSIVARVPAKGLASYAATKTALHAFLEGLRLDYAASGLRVTEIVPGVIRTEFAESRLAGDAARASRFYEGFAACLSPEDVARAALFALAQPDSVSLDEIVMRPTRR